MKCAKSENILCYVFLLFYVATGQDDTLQQAGVQLFGHRVVGGHDAQPGELPFQVAIQRKHYFGDGSFHWCGGSILDSEHVLTAGHCVYGLPTPEIIVHAGVINSSWQEPEEYRVVRQVTHVFLHEKFLIDTYINDMAILKVSPGFPTDNPYVKAIPLRTEAASEGLACTVSGWGLLDHQKRTKTQILQVVALPFIPHDICRHIYRNYTDGSVEPGMNCAGYLEGGKDACNGDSGGPLQCGGLLTGVVSWGEQCALPNYPGVYADVAYYKDWIRQQLDRSKTEFIFRM